MAVLFCKSSFYSLFFVWWYFFCRKDGFPGADGSSITQATQNAATIPIYGATGNQLAEDSNKGLRRVYITTQGVLNGSTTLIYSIKNPLTLITKATAPQDWYTDNELYQDGNLWSNSKSMYDPCPHGWKVTPDGTWSDFSIENTPCYINGVKTNTGSFNMTNGRLYNHQGWYPAVGFRVFDGIRLYAVGCEGYYWSSTSNSINSLRINLSISELKYGSNSRAYGFAVRCVQE